MQNLIMDSFVIILFLMIIWKIEIIKPFKNFNEEYLSLKSTKVLKGIFSIVVVFHHLAQRTTGGILFHKFTQIGYFATGIFFFISGYALQKKYMADSNYEKGFLKKRFPTVFIPYLIMYIIYWLENALVGHMFTLKEMLRLLLKGEPIVAFSWYVITILIFYIIFYILMKWSKRSNTKMIIGMISYYVIWVLLCRYLNYGKYWYNSSHLLVLGVIYAITEKRILPFIQRCYRALLPLSIFIFSICLKYESELAKFFNVRGIKFLIPLVSVTFFALAVLLLLMKFRIGNKLLNILGEISFEIYLAQGLWFLLLRNNKIWIHNSIIFSILIVIGTIFVSYFLHLFFKYILKKYKSLISLKG